jgi:5-formyltetrahydrofolate cyclo-ligase
MSHHGEFDTFSLIKNAQEQQAKLCFPKTNLSTWEISFFQLDDLTQTSVNAIGITEPNSDVLTEPHTIDIFITPLLAHDSRGFRIGYGKGCYDRYFTQCNHAHRKVGLTVFDQPTEFECVEKTDAKLDVCYTPFSTYIFK